MSPSPQKLVDYDALAAQARGEASSASASVDYDALAAQAAGHSTPAETAQNTPPSAGPVSRFVSGVAETLNPLPLITMLTDRSQVDPDEAALLQGAGAPPGLGNVVRSVVQAQRGEWQKAKDAYNTGHYGDAAMYALSTAAPVVGPMVTHAGETAKAGDYAGAAGQVTGMIAGPKMMPKVAEGLARVPEALPAVEAAMRARRGTTTTTAAGKMLGDLTKALPPTQTAPYAPGDVVRATPYLTAEHASAPITSVEALRDAAQSAITQIEAQVGQYIDAHPQDLIRTQPLAAARSALARGVRASDLELGMRELNDLGLDQPLTLAQADAIRLRLNQENAATLAKNNIDQFKARTTDPAFAAREAAAEALRAGIYDQLAARGVDAKALRMDEGALMKLRNAALRQIYAGERPVAGTGTNTLTSRVIRRTAPVVGGVAGASLGGVLGAGVGTELGMSVSKRLASPNLTRNALIERAFSHLKGDTAPAYPVMPPDAPVRGLLPSPPIVSHVPDTSYVRSVPAPRAPSALRALPSHEGRPMPSAPDRSGVRTIPARGRIVRDPKTGRFKRIYTTEID